MGAIARKKAAEERALFKPVFELRGIEFFILKRIAQCAKAGRLTTYSALAGELEAKTGLQITRFKMRRIVGNLEKQGLVLQSSGKPVHVGLNPVALNEINDFLKASDALLVKARQLTENKEYAEQQAARQIRNIIAETV